MTSAIEQMASPVPRQPWNQKKQTLIRSAFILGCSLIISWLLSAVTELGGVLGFYLALAVTYPILAWVESLRRGRNLATDSFVSAVIVALFGAVVIPWFSIFSEVVRNGLKAFHSSYLTSDMRFTASSEALEFGGVLHAVVGTLLMVLIATVISVPLGIMTAIYIVEIKGRAAGIVRVLNQAMSGVPSIVAGLFIYATVVIFFGSFSAWAGGLSLVILMLPTVGRTAEEVLKLVPDELRSASYSLGASQSRTTFKIVLPTVASGLVTSAILGVARVVGETAPLILTASYFVATSTNLSQPMASLPIYIFSNLGLGDDNAVARAWGGCLVLLGVVFIAFAIARALSARVAKK